MIVFMDTLFLAHLFLCSFLRLTRTGNINFFRSFCRFNQKSNSVVYDLDKPDSYNCIFPIITAFRLETRLPYPHDGQGFPFVHRTQARLQICIFQNKTRGQQLLFLNKMNLKPFAFPPFRSQVLLHALCFFFYVLYCTYVKESIFRILIHLTIKNSLKSSDSLLNRNINTLDTCKVFSYMEWL